MNTGNREKRKNRIDNSFNKPPYSILLLCLPQTKNPANAGLDEIKILFENIILSTSWAEGGINRKSCIEIIHKH